MLYKGGVRARDQIWPKPTAHPHIHTHMQARTGWCPGGACRGTFAAAPPGASACRAARAPPVAVRRHVCECMGGQSVSGGNTTQTSMHPYTHKYTSNTIRTSRMRAAAPVSTLTARLVRAISALSRWYSSACVWFFIHLIGFSCVFI